MFNEFASLICSRFRLHEQRYFFELAVWLESGGGRLSVSDLPTEILRSKLMNSGEWWDDLCREQELLYKMGAAILHLWHPQYPARLLDLETPPLFLAWWGRLSKQGQAMLAIVGSRQPQYDSGLWLDLELPRLLKARNIVIASGGARGIDQKAHLLALRNGAPTILFLPSGLKQLYPKDISSWVPEIQAGGGAIVSEFLPSLSMHKHHFHLRNRLIAGISDLTLIVEARRKSGTMLTAHQAIALGRGIAVLPGLATRGETLGNLDLLATGFPVVRDHYDLMLLLDREGVCVHLPKNAEISEIRI